MQDAADDRLRKLTAALTARMSRVRGEMTDAEFAQLLTDMVRTAERFAEIDDMPSSMAPDMPPDQIRQLLDIKVD